jgi:adenylosuccinate lyase
MLKMHKDVNKAIQMLVSVGESEDRDLSLPMIRKYYPTELQPYFGDDQTAGWLMLVEWFWMKALGHSGVMPREDALLMSDDLLLRVLSGITTKMQVARERGTDGHKATKHDINALLELMREVMPKELHKWLHFGATSYDIIETAYSLQMRVAFENVVLPKMKSVDLLWCQKIESYSLVGRTCKQRFQ